MQNTLREDKAQRWRALAVLDNGEEALLCLGGSIVQIRERYQDACFEVLDSDVRQQMTEIELQKWSGMPDRGHWVTQTNLPLP